MTNPIYAGAYVFGRTGSRVSVEAGRTSVEARNREEVELPRNL
jgi:hypothetical protein